VRITADTNLLLRAILEDHPQQGRQAREAMQRASLIAVPLTVFCELVWTMRRLYQRQPGEIADVIEAMLRVESIVTDRPAVEMGIAMLRAGGDFADAIIAWEGAAMGGDVLGTFDREAVRLLSVIGLDAAEPGRLLQA